MTILLQDTINQVVNGVAVTLSVYAEYDSQASEVIFTVEDLTNGAEVALCLPCSSLEEAGKATLRMCLPNFLGGLTDTLRFARRSAVGGRGR